MLKSVFMAGVLLIAGTASAAEKVQHFVDVDGARYRVEVKGDEVTVAKKAVLVKWNMKERDAQRRAVLAATGCEVVDEFEVRNAKLKGRLKCPSSN